MSHSSLIGRTLRNRYKIIELLGSGGFGYTYKAKDLDLPRQRTCVVKHFKPKNQAPDKMPVAQKLFEKEAQNLERLGKENNQIPELFAYFEEDSQFYLVQELIEGHDLTHEIIVGSCKSEQVVFKLLKDILEVLAFVHQNNVIHRDIKPENLRRRLKDGKIVLIDFGAVKEISAISVDSQGKTSLTVAIGTRGYMPVEQQDCRPCFSSDLYALGIICFQALTGLEPLKLPRDFNTGELYCDLFSECSSLNLSFKEVLDTMVRFDYRQRYNNATVALQALEPLLLIYQASTTVQTPITKFSPQSQTLQTPNSTTEQSQTVVTSVRTPISSSPVQQSLLERILQALQQLFGGSEIKNSPPSATIPQPTPLTQNWEQPEGHVSIDSGFYVERPPIESDCYETILQPGALIRIKAPRQMGKTSLLTRVLHHAEEQGYKTANLNFQAADAESFTSLDKSLTVVL